MPLTKFEISGYRCFDKDVQFDEPKTVNLVIGKNNSGKSSFLNVIKAIYCGKELKTNNHFSYSFYHLIEEKDICFLKLFENNDSTVMPLTTFDSVDYRKELVGKEIKIVVSKRGKFIDNTNRHFLSGIRRNYKLGFSGSGSISASNVTYIPIMISSERDVKGEGGSSTEVQANGTGLTGAFLYHSTKTIGNRKLIKAVLDDINDLLKGEERFISLNVFDNGVSHVIHLENEKGEISLDEMGSGIKTLIFVSFLIEKEKLYPSDSIFMFEELENNLHPEIQRRLFNKIYQFAVQYKKRVFITSHSHVAINCFYGKEDTRIYHIKKENNASYIETIDSDLSKGMILDDLGVKASDIFQTNGIIWVEGPSDRVYINKWLKLVNPSIREYEHYSFLYYGGKLLSHYSAEEEEGMISILLTNRHSAIVIDSDVKEAGGEINVTKRRVESEFKNKGLFCWITLGREIENYIHKDVINRKHISKDHKQIKEYQDFKDYISDDDPYFESHKVKTAEGLSFEKNDLEIMDLNDKIVELVRIINSWNKTPVE